MAFVVLAAGASALARSIVHSHQDSFGHELEVVHASSSGLDGLGVACACGWSGVLLRQDVSLDDLRLAVPA